MQRAFLANVRTNKLGETWFDSSLPQRSLEVPGDGKGGDRDRKLVDERTLNLGKSIRPFPFLSSVVWLSSASVTIPGALQASIPSMS